MLIEVQVRSIVAEVLDVDKEIINEVGGSKIDAIELIDYGLNSITFIKIVVALESHFGIEFNDYELNYELFSTVGDLIKYVAKKLESKL